MYDKTYDFAIVGAGPAGLSLAWYLAKYNYNVLLIEREAEIGGCHRVRRVADKFTEHGPRIYVDNYLIFFDLLDDMNLRFTDFFTPYQFNISETVSRTFGTLKPFEIFWFATAYVRFFFDKNYSRKITMLDFMREHHFTPETIDYLDRLCRLTDGAGADRYTLFEFLEILNQNTFYTIYQPKIPNDLGLFKAWREKLLETDRVTIWTNSEVVRIHSDRDAQINGLTVTCDNSEIRNVLAKNFILAIPPSHLVKILQNSFQPSVRNAFGPLTEFNVWVEKTRYLEYIPITYHWNTKLQLDKIWGYPKTSWGVVFINLSDHFNNSESNNSESKNSESKTLLSTAITISDKPSKYSGKTANSCSSEQELKNEVFQQLKESYPDLPEPDENILSPGVYKSGNKWTTRDSAFMLTTSGYWTRNSPIFSNLYSVGTHNGNSNYSFTAMESAIANSLSLVHQLVPKSKNDFIIRSPFTISKFIAFILLVLLILILYKLNIIL